MATRAQTQLRNRESLITATIELVASDGYRAATVDMIASRAGLTTGAVYSTFGSKREMFLAAITKSRDGLRLQTELDLPADQPATAILSRFGSAMVRAVRSTQARELYSFELKLATLVLHDAQLRARLRAEGDGITAALANALTGQRHSQGSLSAEVAERIATSAVAVTRGLVQRCLSFGDSVDSELVVDSCVALANLG